MRYHVPMAMDDYAASGLRLYRAEEVAPFLDVSCARVYELVRLGILPSVRLGRQVRFDAVAIGQWIAAGGCPRATNGQGYVNRS